MHRLRLSLILLAAALWAGAPAASLQPERRPVVALVSLDGFPAALWRDPALPAPTLRALAAAGAAASMTPVNPSVTWPNHTTFVTGVSPARHDVLFNGRLLRQGHAHCAHARAHHAARERRLGEAQLAAQHGRPR